MRKTLLFLFLFIANCASAQYENLLHKTYAERRPLLRGYYIHELLGGDDAVRQRMQSIISGIAAAAKANNDDDLGFEAQLMQIHLDSKWKAYGYDSVLVKLDLLRNVAIAKDKLWLKARTESMAALTCFSGMKNYELSFDYFYKLRNTLQRISKEEFPEKQVCFHQMGFSYYACHDFTNAISFFKEGIRETPSDPGDQFLTEIISMVGVCYRDIGQLDSAHTYFVKALQSIRFTREADNQWVGIVNGYMGGNYYLQQNYDAAERCLQTCIDTALKYKDISLAATAMTDMGAVNLKTGNISDATKNLFQAADYLRMTGYNSGFVKLYPLLARLQTVTGKHAAAAQYLDSFIVARDSIDMKFNVMIAARGQQRAELQEKKALEDENSKRKMQRNFLLIFIGVLAAGSVYIYRLQHKKHQQKERIKNLELQQKQAELDFATKQLNDFAAEISQKNKSVEELQEKLGTSINEDVLTQLQQSTILTDSEWDRFRLLFAQVHGGYLIHLKEKLPDLSPAETRFMVLAKLKFTNKEMAAALGVSPHAVRVTWYRLRKKLNLPEEGSPEELVTKI